MAFLTMTITEQVATIKLDHPPANALSAAVLQEISQMMDKLVNDDQVKAVLIHGEGRFFSAGADIKEFTTITGKADAAQLAKHGQTVFEKVENLAKPVIAVIHGAALGGGLELAMACHIRLVSEDAKLGLPELQLGLIPGFAGTQRLPRIVGTAKAAEMILTGEAITGAEAVQCGLANHAYPGTQLLMKAQELVKKITNKSPASISAVMELLRYSKTERFYEGLEREAEAFSAVLDSKDGKEGIQAFMEKRKPVFTGNEIG